MSHRTALLLALVGVTAGCNPAITDLGDADADVLAQVARVSQGQVTPAERVLVDLLQRGSRDPGSPLDLPQLDSLYALTSSERLSGDAQDLIRRHDRVSREAWAAIDAGDAGAGERWLEEARGIQSDFVASRLGRGGALGYIALVDRSLEQSRAAVSERTPRRVVRMLDTATDLHDEAREAIRAGRIADAFDLASHAAGLANTISASLQD